MFPKRLFVAVVGVSGLAAASLLWGSVVLQAPPRSHLAALVAVVGAAAAFLVRRADKNALARWTSGALSLVVFLAAIVLGGYDHLLKVVLAGHGISLFGPTGDWFYEAVGLALLPLGAAGLTTLKTLAPKKDEE